MPAGPAFEYPVTAKGRLTTGQRVRGDHRPAGATTARSSASATSPGSSLARRTTSTAGWLNGKPAGTIPIYQYSDANALDIVDAGPRRRWTAWPRTFPQGLEYRIAYDTTNYVRREHQRGRAHAGRGVRAGADRRVRVPAGLPGHDHPACWRSRSRWSRRSRLMAAFGFSINTLTLCGLVLAIGLVVDDAIIVVENVEKFLERGVQPLDATRAAMAEITTPIVTITLVLAAVFVPVAFIPGLTGRLYNQFALTIVFSFVFSAFNSLTFSPAMARLFLRPRRHGESKFFFFRWFNRGHELAGEFLRRVPRIHGPPLVDDRRSLAGAAGAHGLDARRAAQGVHPDGGPGLPDRHRADSRRHDPGADRRGHGSRRADRPARWRGWPARSGSTASIRSRRSTRPNCGAVYVILEDWRSATEPALAGPALVSRASGSSFRRRSARPIALVVPAAADPGAEPDRRLRVHDRGSRGQGVEALADGHRPLPGRGPEAARACPALFTPFSVRVPQLRFELDRVKARTPRRARLRRLRDAPGRTWAAIYVNDFNLYGKVWKVIVQADGERRRQPDDILALKVLNHQGERVPLSALGRREVDRRADRRAALQPVQRRQDHRPARAGYSSGQAIAAMEEVAADRAPAGGFGYEWTGTTYQEQKTGNHGDVHLRPVDRLRVPVHGGPLRELDPPAGDHPHGARWRCSGRSSASGSTTCRWTSSARSAW